jgi:aminoglycoside phosphotransferase (APT) family kinase protein
LSAAGAARLRGHTDAYASWCAELEAFGIAATLQHNDLHDANAFPVVDGSGGLVDVVVFDFGDAVVGHPFTSLLGTLRSAAHHLGIAPGSPGLARLRHAYLEPWTAEHSRADLDRAVELAVRLGTVSKAAAWQRALSGARPQGLAEFADAVPGWLLEEFEPAVL